MTHRQTIVLGLVVDRKQNRVLTAIRPPDRHLAGYREYPGGKLAVGESIRVALERELREETGIEVIRTHRLVSYDVDFPDRLLTLDAWIVDDWSGVPVGREGQVVEWIELDHLAQAGFPSANDRINRLLSLPTLYAITPDAVTTDTLMLERVLEAIRAGLGLLQFRSKSAGVDRQREIFQQLLVQCEASGCRLLYNGPLSLALEMGAHGLHLDSRHLRDWRGESLPPDFLLAASCHDEAELLVAGQHGLDLCVLGPVRETTSHPGRPGMGWDAFERLAGMATLPVYALGGVRPEDLARAQSRQAHGIAMISGIWGCASPAGMPGSHDLIRDH